MMLSKIYLLKPVMPINLKKGGQLLYYQIYCFMIKMRHTNWTYLSYVLGWPKNIQTGDNQFISTTYRKVCPPSQ